jgi:hypothetical protein
MTTEQFLAATAKGIEPLVIRTRGGETYTLRSHSFWISDDYPETLVFTIPHQGIHLLAIEAIDSVQVEHEAMPLR